ncbi:hypothetical protein BP6252_04570 [Coleophoma cylindrospora]|uniref:N-acetyltransferase domain-containing protein n=1 Tax=Coleophoma cylindrospora TaxID=1849047 RepID=A0A3D8S0U6_9HELO|nr:hypothetical protein BP6252_04570 [Coleophoma cylindrospora]
MGEKTADLVTPVPKSQVLVRPAAEKDIQAISALGAHVFTLTFGYSMPASDLAAYLEDAYSLASIARDLANPLVDIIVAVDPQDTVMGFVQLTQGTTDPCLEGVESPIELQRLYVSQDFHGSGVGRKLYETVEGMARQRGFKTLWLGVWEENFKAQKVYERFGFSKIGMHDFVMGECVQTDWILSKTL